MGILSTVLAFDWSTLGGPASDIAIDLAKEELGDLANVAKQGIRKKWSSIDWGSTQSKYKSNLLDSISKTRVLGNPKLIEIESIYTDCFVYDRPSALIHFAGDIRTIEKDASSLRNNAERQSALSVAQTGDSLYILGRPGAGKTTFLRYLAILACRGEIEKTPIFITLKDWSDSHLTIEKFIAKQFEICGLPDVAPFTRALLEEGKALILLDGLDEVNEEGGKRNQIIKEIVTLSLKYRKCQICLTCRTAATDYSFERFKYIEVADFTKEQQLNFIKQWYGRNASQLQRFMQGWQEPSNQGIRDLGRTPLLITLLCLAFDETLQFPPRQVDLYREAIDALLKKWDSSRLIGRDTFYKNLSFSRREHLLEYIAAHFYFNSQTVFQKRNIETYISNFLNGLPDKEKSEKADAEIVLKQIEAQHGLIIERARNIYSFSHLTIQEYFTASYIVQSYDANLLEQIIGIALKDQKWREVVLYTVALLPSAEPILKIMAAHLQRMRVENTGASKFLTYSYCSGMAEKNPRHNIEGYFSLDIAIQIQQSVEKSSPLPLTQAELAKIREHLTKINTFLKTKATKFEFGNAPEVFASAFKFISEKPSQAAKFLGGHKARPDDFISYLYACRLMIESLEVAFSENRATHLKSVLSIDDDVILLSAGIT